MQGSIYVRLLKINFFSYLFKQSSILFYNLIQKNKKRNIDYLIFLINFIDSKEANPILLGSYFFKQKEIYLIDNKQVWLR